MNSEYTVAVHSLVYLASLPERMANSEMIADNVCTHAARIRKIMGVLRSNGYIRTKEGVGGGFQLAILPTEINLGDLYRIICGGSLKPTWFSGNAERNCPVSSNITHALDSIYFEAEQQLGTYLAKWTIDDVLKRVIQLDRVKDALDIIK